MIKLSLAQASLNYIDTHFVEDLNNDEHFRAVRNRYERAIQISKQKLDTIKSDSIKPLPKTTPILKKMLLELIDMKRTELSKYLQNGSFDEELIREKERELDLEEARLRSREG
ncbi:hypothetical protein [Niabella ginsengisoli]|uniref:Uncharacterized protein n=1 Tax=Niabella ginsengisoli TaxID=522298 RepID=A0ABS9SP08_9BACT|nr:hypothetical protein [Niabella ginsengisoli]MCH5600112.1 hypothetical protein [Niabella ginsengisoli]